MRIDVIAEHEGKVHEGLVTFLLFVDSGEGLVLAGHRRGAERGAGFRLSARHVGRRAAVAALSDFGPPAVRRFTIGAEGPASLTLELRRSPTLRVQAWSLVGEPTAVRRRALEGLVHALLSFASEGCPLRLDWEFRDVSKEAEPHEHLWQAPGMGELPQLEEHWSADGAINVYYADEVTAAGRSSPRRGQASVSSLVLGRASSEHLFTHEFGHVLGLPDLEDATVSERNIMVRFSRDRRFLTEAQVCAAGERALELAGVVTGEATDDCRFDAEAVGIGDEAAGHADAVARAEARRQIERAPQAIEQALREPELLQASADRRRLDEALDRLRDGIEVHFGRRAAGPPPPVRLPGAGSDEIVRLARERYERRMRFVAENESLFAPDDLRLLRSWTSDQHAHQALADARARSRVREAAAGPTGPRSESTGAPPEPSAPPEGGAPKPRGSHHRRGRESK